MKSIEFAYVNALLAGASYQLVRSDLTSDELREALRNSMTLTQAAYIAANFEVAASELSLTGGLDAVVWKIKSNSTLAGPNNIDAGKVFVSLRGTEGLQDTIDDLSLATRGIPQQQITSRVDWWWQPACTAEVVRFSAGATAITGVETGFRIGLAPLTRIGQTVIAPSMSVAP